MTKVHYVQTKNIDLYKFYSDYRIGFLDPASDWGILIHKCNYFGTYRPTVNWKLAGWPAVPSKKQYSQEWYKIKSLLTANQKVALMQWTALG
jgi:hypothetical protein